MPTLTRKGHIAVVDAYSGGRYLIGAFQALGYPVIHIQSGPIEYYARDNEFAAARADRHLTFDGDIDGLVRTLRAASVRLVLVGSEGGVLLADQLAHRLGLPFRNDIGLSTARRDKYEMQERLRQAGLASTAQARVSDTGELDAWLAGRNAYPVVVKPLRSAATDGVFVCRSAEKARSALKDILARRDMFGMPNSAAVCQEFLVGTEYVLNGVVGDGTCVFTEGWRSDKVDHAGAPLYDTQYLFCPGDPGFEELSRYVSDVCRALGIVNGPFHAEVMLTCDGPVLIEVGARLAGGADPYVIETCLGHSQLGLLVDAALHPERFTGYARHADQSATRPKRAAYVYLIARTEGQVVREVELDEFFRVDGVIHADYRYALGETQQITRDLVSAAGVVLVTADDQQQLGAAVHRIREIEAAMYAASIEPVAVSAG
ncbi:ATP-grasp domain-containing protein [Streptomyces sp. NPDC051104]|uniref:ATP-grasp domain-containing protein n=1 Tax=Streptomyces sp. NPDC051104 TaxID=3155044 RepID=UPI00341A56BC